MLVLSNSLLNQSVLSLRTSGEIASGTVPIFNPNNLKIEGFYCDDRFEKKRLILLSQDIRDRIAGGFVVNDHEVLVEPNELIRLQKILEVDFGLIGKPVVTVNKQRLGKVNDYAVDSETLYVQKLYVTQKLIKSFSGGNLSVDRSQIVEITDRQIIVQEPLKGVKNAVPAGAASPAA
jgi:sporulation protein YlmC with PRC-barrel domain